MCFSKTRAPQPTALSRDSFEIQTLHSPNEHAIAFNCFHQLYFLGQYRLVHLNLFHEYLCSITSVPVAAGVVVPAEVAVAVPVVVSVRVGNS